MAAKVEMFSNLLVLGVAVCAIWLAAKANLVAHP
jgi:hypothetical protein